MESVVEAKRLKIEEEKRNASALVEELREEKDEKIRKELQEMAFDAQIEGTEAQKNSFLAPAPKVPKIDVEIAESQGKTVGLEELPPPDKDTRSTRHG